MIALFKTFCIKNKDTLFEKCYHNSVQMRHTITDRD